MKVFIVFIIAAVVAFYFIRKKLQEKYRTEFVKKTGWVLIGPLLQVVFLGSSILASALIFMQYLAIYIDLSEHVGLYTYNLYVWDAALKMDYAKELIRSSQYFDSLGVVALVASAFAVIGFVLFTVVTVQQIRGILMNGNSHKVRKAYDKILIIYTVVTLVSMAYYLNLSMCVEDCGENFGVYTDYIDFAVRVIFFAAVLVCFYFLRKKFSAAVNVFFEQQEQEMVSAAGNMEMNAANGNNTVSKTRQLLELKELLDKGILTQEEYEKEKYKILNP